MTRIVLCLLLTMLTFPALAVMHPDEKLRDPALESRARALTQTLRCVVCQNESVEDSHADIARDLRIMVRKQILEGKTDAQITDYLRGRYGDYILLAPPVTTRTYILWLAPLLVLGTGLLLIIFQFKPRKRR